jgi:sporulation protein YlmC with PRC-barrel domain
VASSSRDRGSGASVLGYQHEAGGGSKHVHSLTHDPLVQEREFSMTTHDNATLSKLSDTGKTVDGSADDIRGRKVKDKDGNDLGKVHDLLIDDEGKVRFLLIEHGGFLGMGETKSFIPVDAITRITEDDVLISHTREHVAGAPGYDPALINDRGYHQGIYSYYGYPPYWAAGYAYPGRLFI